jgi:transposase-like protein
MNKPHRHHSCEIEQVGKGRNGKPRYWCTTHRASATGRYGIRLSECESAYRDIDGDAAFEMRRDAYPGGVALWGAVKPVLDTTRWPAESGIHIHARREAGGDKIIDATYSAVAMRYRHDLLSEARLIVTQETAINHYVSRFLGHRIKHLYCITCGELHLDAGFFAVRPHRRHLCHGCGRLFNDTERSVSNPIALFRELWGDESDKRSPVLSSRVLDIQQRDYPGGIRIWASNPAILWTADKPEEQGIHVHVYDGDMAKPVVDDTFGVVRIDGQDLDRPMIAHLMAQQSLAYLDNKIASLTCPNCGAPHFDQGMTAFIPHKEHHCDACGHHFRSPGKRRLVVSNPLPSILEGLRKYS